MLTLDIVELSFFQQRAEPFKAFWQHQHTSFQVIQDILEAIGISVYETCL